MEVKVATPEYLSRDIFEEDFLKTFSALYGFQYLFGSCRLHAKDRFVTPPTTPQKIYTIFCIILTIMSFCVISLNLNTHDPGIHYLNVASLVVDFLAFFCNIIHARFFNGNRNVEFYVRLQKVDRLLKIDRWNVLNGWVRALTNYTLAIMQVGFFLLLTLLCIDQKMACLANIGPGYCIMCFLYELVACSSILAHFVFRVRLVNCIMENHLSKERLPEVPVRFTSKKYIRYYAQESQNYYETSETNVYLREIFSCFSMYQDLYRFQILVFALESVLGCLVSFELILYTMQHNQYSVANVFIFTVFCMVNFLFTLFLGYRCTLFFSEVKETKRLCIDIMAVQEEGPNRDKARKMLKMIEETPPKFSVYGMWDMNAGTFVATFGLITSLIVTSLQFAFL